MAGNKSWHLTVISFNLIAPIAAASLTASILSAMLVHLVMSARMEILDQLHAALELCIVSPVRIRE